MRLGASDVLGITARTISFNLPTAITNAQFHLITSNHGANSIGEEYTRRLHRLLYDGVLFAQYRPGGVSCEPYRIYNTQANGIYGASPLTDAQWESFSNWCPGQVIPNRVYDLGTMTAGDHEFKIIVPGAQFVNNEGYFPISLYLQGESETLTNANFSMMSYSLSPNPAENFIEIQSSEKVKNYQIFNSVGQQISIGNTNKVDVSRFASGIYIAKIEFENGRKVTEKIVRK